MAKSRFTLQSIATLVDKYSKPMRGMTRATNSFSKSSQRGFARVSKSGSRMGGALKSALAFVSIGLIARQAKKAVVDFATAGDEIAKTSRQIGTSAETLQELRFAADRQGVSNATLTKSLQMLNKNVGDAKAGTGALTTYLNKTNPALLNQFKAVSSNDEAFQLYIREVNKLKTPMEKAALSQALFGRSGQDLMKLAEAGPEGIAALRKEAQKYGIVMSTQAANQSEKFVDSLTNMKSAFKGLGMSVLSEAMVPLTKLMQDAANYFAANRGLISVKIKEWIGYLKIAFSYVVTILKILWKLKYVIALVYGLVKAFQAYRAVMAVVNVVMSANPVGAVIMGITILIGLVVLAVKNWNTFGAVMLKVIKFMMPGLSFLLSIIEAIMIFKNRWSDVVNAFKVGGIVAGFKMIGKVILDAVLLPIQQLLGLLSKIPGVGKLIKPAVAAIQGFRENKLGAKPATANNTTTVNNTYASPKSRRGAGKRSTKGSIDINVNGQKEYASVERGGTMPPNTRLNLGLQ